MKIKGTGPKGAHILPPHSFWENMAKLYVGTPLGSWYPLPGEILDLPLPCALLRSAIAIGMVEIHMGEIHNQVSAFNTKLPHQASTGHNFFAAAKSFDADIAIFANFV